MIKTNSFTIHENIDLTKEISLVYPLDTPLTTMLLSKGQYEDGLSKIVTWREKSLDTTEDISFPEGSETDTFQSSNRAEKSNVMQIFKKAVSVSGTAEASKIVGINDLLAEEINDRLAEIKVQVERAVITGEKNDGSVTPFIRKMQGLVNFAHVDNIIKKTNFMAEFPNAVKKLWGNGLGSNEFYCMVNAGMKDDLDEFYKENYMYNAPTNEFGIVVHKINTSYGVVNVMLNRHMPEDKAVFFDPRFLRLSFLRKPFFEPLAKTGDSVKAQVITEATIKVLNEKAVVVIDTSN